jgi:hypothetical protein
MIYKYIALLSYEAFGFNLRNGESVLVYLDMAEYPTKVESRFPESGCVNSIRARVGGVLLEFPADAVKVLVNVKYEQTNID